LTSHKNKQSGSSGRSGFTSHVSSGCFSMQVLGFFLHNRQSRGYSSQYSLEKYFLSGQNLRLLSLLGDIQLATTNGLSTKWGRAYHGNATEYREQSEVEGMYGSVVLICRNVRSRT
jgi:hypothetical protein